MKNSLKYGLALFACLVLLGVGLILPRVHAQSTTPISDSLATAMSGLGAADTTFNNQLAVGNNAVAYNDLLTIQSYESGVKALQAKYQGQ